MTPASFQARGPEQADLTASRGKWLRRAEKLAGVDPLQERSWQRLFDCRISTNRERGHRRCADGPIRVIDDNAISVEPERFLFDDLITLRSALQLGGVEFLEQVIRCCERLLSAGARHDASISLRGYVDPVSMASVTLSDYEKADLHEKRPSAAQGVPVGRGI